MSPLIRKETRLLLPAWVAALVMATMPLWRWHPFEGVSQGLFGEAIFMQMLPLIFVAPLLVLALSPFGQEMSYGTFGLLLVQPEERRRFWRIKTRLLAIALGSVWALFALCLWNSRFWMGQADDLAAFLKMSAMMALLAFSGGLWTTLLLRDMVTSFFCTLIVPIIICAATFLSVSHWIPNGSDLLSNIIFCVLAAYAAAGFLWARRLFLGAQDVAWTGGQISLTAVRGVSFRWLDFAFKGRQNRWTALVKKELQLQEATMFLIPLLALLHLAALAIHHFVPHWTDKEVILGGIPMLWLMAVPLVIGCVAVAEERRLNTLDSLLCLPISKRASFTVKLAVALALGILLGGVIPWLLAFIGSVPPGGFPPLGDAVEVAALITGVAFYASTMSRGLLQAIPTALCIPALIIGTGFFLGLKIFGISGDTGLQCYWTIVVLAWPAMTLTFVWLAFQNYKRLQIGWQVWAGDLTRSVAVFGCVALAVSAVFDRPWELFMPLEPRHGPARLSGTGRASLAVSESNLCVLLPNGRLWVGERNPSAKSLSGGFVSGSNWMEIAAGREGAVALQSDGTLWAIGNTSAIHQIGPDSNWKQLAGRRDWFQALKQDGTLWIAAYVSNSITAPFRVGDDSDWVDVREGNFVKRDGSKWAWKTSPFRARGQRFLGAGLQRDRWSMEGTNWSSLAGGDPNPMLGIRADGSLWASGDLPSKIFGEKVRPGSHREAVRVGTKSDWVALSGEWVFVALEADGTLWTMRSGQSKHPSHYADWLAATEGWKSTWALAKDGTLSRWNAFDTCGYSTFLGEIFLGPTRRPIFSCNILDAE
jgi:hypothetical protein